MDNPRWLLFWRIATTENGLARNHFFTLGLPPPDTVNFKSFTELLPQSQGDQTQQGYINCTLLWDVLTAQQGQTLKRIVDAARTAGTCWATVDRSTGSGLNDFIDVSGKVLPLILAPPSKSRGVVYENVVLTLNALTIENDPSTVL